MATPEELNDLLTNLKDGLLQLSDAVKTATDAETDAERTIRETRERENKAREKADATLEYLSNRRKAAEEAAINQELERLGRRLAIDGKTEKLEDTRLDVLSKVNEALTKSAGVFSGLTGAALDAMKAQVKQQALVDNHIAQIDKQIEASIAYTAAQANQIRMANMALQEKQREVEASKNLGNLGLRQQEIFQDTIGKLKNQLDSTVQLTKQQYNEINAVEQAIKARNKEIDSVKNAGTNLSAMVGSVKDVSSAMQRWKKSELEDAGNKVESVAKVEAKFALFNIGIGIATNAFDLLVAGIKGYYEGMLATQRALFAGERGEKVAQAANIAMLKAMAAQAKASGDNLINLGKEAAAAGLAIAFMIPGSFLFKAGIAAAGLAVGGLTAAMGAAEKVAGELAERQAEVLEMYAEQMDTLFNGFTELAKSSMTGARGMDQLYDNLHKVGFTVKEFDKFNKVLQSNTKEMKMFGVTASEGVDKFAEVSGKLIYSELGHTLRLMGLQTEDIMDHQAKYMAQQNRFGLMQIKTTEQLIKGTSDYIIELDKTAALIGASRKDQEEARKFIMSNEKLRAGMLVEEEKARRTGDFSTLRRMEQAAALAEVLYAKGLKRYAIGTAESYAADTGRGPGISGPESAEAMAAMGKSAFKDINAGVKSNTAIALQASRDILGMASKVAGSRRYGAVTEGYVGDPTGAIVDNAKDTEEFFKEAEKRGIKEGTPEYEKLITELGKTRVATDALTNNQVKLHEDNRDKARKQDDAVRNKDLSALIDLGMFKSSSVTIKTAADKMMDAANKMLKAAGLKDDPSVAPNGIVRPGGVGSVESQVSKQFKNEREKREAVEAATRADREKLEKEKGRASDEVKQARLKEFEAKQRAEQARAYEQHALKRQGAASVWGGPERPSSSSASATTMPGRMTTATDPRVASSQPEQHASASQGSTTPKLASVSSKSGKSASVGSDYAPQFQKLIDYLDTSKYDIVSMGGYNDRDARGKPGVKSIHAYGGALDINPATNPSGSKLVTDMPAEISSIAAGLGLGWGGDWQSTKDAMHFSAAESEGGSLLKAKRGGLFNGPASGYPVELHSREAIVPLPDPSSKISVETSASKAPLNSVLANDNGSSASVNMASRILEDLYNLMEEKFDTMIATLSDGNDITDKLLKHSRV